MVEQIMENLKGQFWTVKEEMLQDIEAAGLEVQEDEGEYIAVEFEDEEVRLQIVKAGSTYVIVGYKE